MNLEGISTFTYRVTFHSICTDGHAIGLYPLVLHSVVYRLTQHNTDGTLVGGLPLQNRSGSLDSVHSHEHTHRLIHVAADGRPVDPLACLKVLHCAV